MFARLLASFISGLAGGLRHWRAGGAHVLVFVMMEVCVVSLSFMLMSMIQSGWFCHKVYRKRQERFCVDIWIASGFFRAFYRQ